MGKKPKLDDFERIKIVDFRNEGLSQRAIAKRINRSQTVVKNFLRDPENYGAKNRGGRPKKMSIRDERAIIRALQDNPNQSMASLKAETGVQVHKETIRRTIKSGFRFHRKRLQHFALKHKQRRLDLTSCSSSKLVNKISTKFVKFSVKKEENKE